MPDTPDEPKVDLDPWLVFHPEKRILAGIDTSREPLYTVGEVAKVFFAKSGDQIRWIERSKDLEFCSRDEQGRRCYTLTNIEDMVWVLGEKKIIGEGQIARALLAVRAEAFLYNYFCDHGTPQGQPCKACNDEEEFKLKAMSRRG